MKINILLVVLIAGCQQQKPFELNKTFITPVVAYGFVIYGSLKNHQMYFVPLKDSTLTTVSKGDFRSDLLDEGFLFNASQRIRDEMGLLKSDSIQNQVIDKRLVKYVGTTFYVPVRIVYEIDPDGFDVLANHTLVDTISLGKNRYERSGEKVAFVVRVPGADVLKVSPCE